MIKFEKTHFQIDALVSEINSTLFPLAFINWDLSLYQSNGTRAELFTLAPAFFPQGASEERRMLMQRLCGSDSTPCKCLLADQYQFVIVHFFERYPFAIFCHNRVSITGTCTLSSTPIIFAGVERYVACAPSILNKNSGEQY